MSENLDTKDKALAAQIIYARKAELETFGMYQFVLCSAMQLSNQSSGTPAWFAWGIPVENHSLAHSAIGPKAFHIAASSPSASNLIPLTSYMLPPDS